MHRPSAASVGRPATADAAGHVDLLALLRQRSLDRRVAYAVAWLRSPAERTADLAVESDDDVAVWLNGVLVHRHVVTRAVRMEADTVTIRLAAGLNRLVYKIGNRDGGFGFGGRLLASSPDALDGITALAAPPADAREAAAEAALTVGPVQLPERAVLDSAGLMVPLVLRVTRWSAPASGTLTLASIHVPVPAGPAGAATDLPLAVSWSSLAGWHTRATRRSPPPRPLVFPPGAAFRR